MPAESLVPGYKLVESFCSDSEYETRTSAADSGGNEDAEEEVEEEVEYVTLEISGIADVDPNLLTSYRLIGVDTPTPFLQLSSSGTIFKGRHHKLLGTELLFTHAQGDSDPSARRMSLLGTTEQRIVFSPVEIRNPTTPSSSSSSKSTSKAKAPGKDSSSNSKKGKKKANVGAGGIEEVAGNLNVGVSKSSASVEREPAAGSGPSTRSKAAGKKKDGAVPDDGGGDMYVTEEDDDAERGEGDATLRGNVGGEGCMGEAETSPNVDLLPQKKPGRSRNDQDEGAGSVYQPATKETPTMAAEPNFVQGQSQQGAPSTASGIPMAIDPALEALQVSSDHPPQVSGSGIGI